MVAILVTIILGGIIGWLASKVMHTDEDMGVVANVVVGVLGAFLGGVIARGLHLGDSTLTQLSIVGLFWSFAGACVLLLFVRWLMSTK